MAQETIQNLKARGLLKKSYGAFSEGGFVYIPVNRKPQEYELVEKRAARQTEKPANLKQALRGILTNSELEIAIRSFDVIGDIAIIEIPEPLAEKQRQIGEAILKTHPNIKTVCKRAGAHSGTYRIRKATVIAGERKTETTYKESGVQLRLDINKTYFSPRLSHERLRIAKQVKPGEKIGAFFAGVGPFPIVIIKHQPKATAVAIELNPESYEYLLHNIKLNRMQNKIKPILGDVSLEARKLGEVFDRVLMPLPKDAGDFLDAAIQSVKNNGTVHFYNFADKQTAFEDTEHIIQKACGKNKVAYKIKNKRIVRPFSPSTVQVSFDFQVIKKPYGLDKCS